MPGNGNMAKRRTEARRAQVAHCWGIPLGMSGIPVVAVLLKLAPLYATAWDLLLVASVLLVLHSALCVAFPKMPAAVEDHVEPAAPSP
jgi:hypothetical protein